MLFRITSFVCAHVFQHSTVLCNIVYHRYFLDQHLKKKVNGKLNYEEFKELLHRIMIWQVHVINWNTMLIMVFSSYAINGRKFEFSIHNKNKHTGLYPVWFSFLQIYLILWKKFKWPPPFLLAFLLMIMCTVILNV